MNKRAAAGTRSGRLLLRRARHDTLHNRSAACGRVSTVGMKRNRIFLVIAALAAAAVGGWLAFGPESGRPAPGASRGLDAAPPGRPGGGRPGAGRAVVVEVAPARSGLMEDRLSAVGSTRAHRAIEVVSVVAGRVDALGFREGETVEEGRILVELDAAQAKAERQEAVANLANARTRLERARALLRTSNATEATVDELTRAVQAAEARLALADAKLADRQIRAPFSGTVGLRRVDVGAYVTPGAPITTLDDTDPIDVEFTVPERFLRELSPGLPLTIRSAAYEGTLFEGRVRSVDSRVSEVARTVQLRAEIANAEGLLRPGMFVTVELVLNARPEAVIVPETALIADGERNYIYVIENDTANRVEVEVGQRRPGAVEIRRGVSAGQMVATAGLQNLRPGAAVTIGGRPPANGQQPTS
jgi:membrane fusion protein (multidrug efflux system)